MSADQDLNTKAEIVYVKLIDEMIDVWRPVSALRIAADTYEILPEGFDPDIETWEFAPGERVTVKARDEPEGKSLVAVARAATR